MRKQKTTRTCKACYNSFLKQDAQEAKEKIQIAYNKEEDRIIVDENLKIQGFSKTMYLCRKKECIEKIIKKKGIIRFLKLARELKEEEIIRIREYAK